MKSLFVILLASCFFAIGSASPAVAFKDLNMEELQRQARAGDPAAQTQLGVAYAKGTGVEANQKEAVKWYQQAADQGYANAQWNLAFRYVRGEGVSQDFQEAARYFELAAEQGYAPAEFDLGMMYLQGLGVTRSRAKAVDWVVKASEHGYKEADAFLSSRGIVKKSEQEEEKRD